VAEAGEEEEGGEEEEKERDLNLEPMYCLLTA
jgi:hypothetical protein